MSPRDFWSRRLLNAAGVYPTDARRIVQHHLNMRRIDRIRDWVWSHARSRLLMGSFRYEAVEGDGKTYDQKAREGLVPTYGQRMADKVRIYNETGNLEMLIDAFNYIHLEVLQPTHPTPHFKSTERHE